IFDGEETAPIERGMTSTTGGTSVPAGPAEERAAAILARFDEDTPQGYQQATAMLETQGNRVGQAEAALLLHTRYGPDPILVGNAQGLLNGYESEAAAH